MKSAINSLVLAALLSSSVIAQLVQYTPDPADWSQIIASVDDHSPSGDYTPWDGVPFNTPANIQLKETNYTKFKEEFQAFLCPTMTDMRRGKKLRGINDLYGTGPGQMSFADHSKPTKAEVDEWTIRVIKHIRNLIGGLNTTIGMTHCLSAQTLWAQERQMSNIWDSK